MAERYFWFAVFLCLSCAMFAVLHGCGDVCVKKYIMPNGAKCARVAGTTFIECDDKSNYINPPSFKVVCE